MAPLLTRSIGTKVSEEDYELLRDVAGDRKLGDWVREVVLRAALGDPRTVAERTILGELLALRKIVLNLQFAAVAGEPLTRERMLGWIAEADAEKTTKASARLAAPE